MSSPNDPVREEVIDLLLAGHSVDYVCEQALVRRWHGWVRADVLRVVEHLGWTLDKHGRLPFLPRRDAHRRADGYVGTPGPHQSPRAPAAPAPAEPPGAPQLPPATADSGEADRHTTQAACETSVPVAVHRSAPPAGTQSDVLALGLAHQHPAVRAQAQRVQRAVDGLCSALARHHA